MDEGVLVIEDALFHDEVDFIWMSSTSVLNLYGIQATVLR
jgi:hypothetical protein